MPQETQLAHRNIRDTNLAYISNQSPTVTEPCYVSGSSDILTGINGYAQRRPGFSDAVERTPTVFNNLVREFTWDDFSGNFYVMACNVNIASNSEVYKMQIGVDSSFVKLYTDTSGPNPFDFVVSNNTCYFGNGVVMKKWNPTIGLQNWGIAIGSVNNAIGPNPTGAGADGGGFPSIGNPNNITTNNPATPATVTITDSIFNAGIIYAKTFGFAIPATTTVTGIQVTISGSQDNIIGQAQVYLSGDNGVSIVGSFRNATLPASNGTVTLGGTSDTWNVPASSLSSLLNGNFALRIYLSNVSSPGTTNFQVYYVQVTVYGVGGPSIAVSGSAGTMTATVGYEYVFTYGNSVTGHISSPTPASASTGTFANKLNVQVSLTASTDPQVNQIHVYRTTDSAGPGVIGGTFFELPTSPYANSTTNITDNAADTALNVASIAPSPGFNDPPPASFGFVYFSGRIYMIAGNKVWFTGLEEITVGVPEESVPSGVAGNFWSFDQSPNGLGVAGTGTNQTAIVFCGGRLYGISGNTLDTFQRFLISNRRGCRNRSAITMLGGMVAWLDSANQIWATDGKSLEELSIPIRPDLTSIAQSACSMTFHTAGNYHWLVFSTGTKMFIYDVDMEQWMPPWSFAARYLFSGEVSDGNYVLMASNATKALQLNPNKFNDNGATYSPLARTNLFSVVPDFGRRFSYLASGSYDEPSRTGVPWFVQVDTNKTTLRDVAIIADEDPTTGNFTSIFSQATTVQQAWNRNPGTNIQQNVYSMTQPASRWIGLQIALQNADQLDKIYGFFMAYKALGGK